MNPQNELIVRLTAALPRSPPWMLSCSQNSNKPTKKQYSYHAAGWYLDLVETIRLKKYRGAIWAVEGAGVLNNSAFSWGRLMITACS